MSPYTLGVDRRARGIGSTGSFGMFVVMLSAGIGVLSRVSPAAAVALAVLVVAAALIVRFADVPASVVLISILVLSGALIDLPSRVGTGRVSLNADVTGAYAVAGLIVVSMDSRRLPRSMATPFLGLFSAYALFSIAWGARAISSFQNVLVLLVAFCAYIAASRIGFHTNYGVALAEKLFDRASICALALYAASIAFGGIGAGTVVGARSFALFGLLVLAWGVAGWRYARPHGRTLTAIAAALILLSLSRAAFGAGAVVVALAWWKPRSISGWLRSAVIATGVAGAAYAAVGRFAPLHARFFTGDVRPVAHGFSVNVEGRSQLWASTWHSFLTSPIVGHGAGSADALVTALYGNTIKHPHDDYLRVLHDYGAIGAAAWAFACIALARAAWKSWHAREDAFGVPDRDRKVTRIHSAAFLTMFALALAMITDNVLDYVFVMAPAGALVGLSAGLRWRRLEPSANPFEHLEGLPPPRSASEGEVA